MSYTAKTKVNTPHLSYPYGVTIFIAAIPTGFQIANTKKGGALNFKGPSQDGGQTKVFLNLRASLLNDDLSNKPKARTYYLYNISLASSTKRFET
jgi:hypothetical protein